MSNELPLDPEFAATTETEAEKARRLHRARPASDGATPGRRGRPPGSQNRTAIGEGPRERAPSAAAGELRERDLSASLLGIFRILTMVSRSRAEFEEREFDDLSRDLVGLARRFEPLKKALLALGPVAVALRLADKVRKVARGRDKPAEPQEGQPGVLPFERAAH